MAAPAALPPFEPPLGPQPLVGTLYSPQQVTLVLREKVFSLSGDTFTVQTAEGVNVLQVKGKGQWKWLDNQLPIYARHTTQESRIGDIGEEDEC